MARKRQDLQTRGVPSDQTRDVPPLSMRAAVRPGSVNAEKRTVDVVWTTGAKVLRGFFEKFFEELSLDPAHVRMARLNNGAPLLNAHDVYDARTVLGVVESARIVNGEGVATVRFAKAEDDPAADVVFRKVRDGILQNASVGYRTYKFEKVEGGDAEIPTYRAVDWEPFEISVVPSGADDGAGFRGVEAQHPTNSCHFTQSQPQPSQETRTMADPTKQASPTPQPDAQPGNAVEAATRAAAQARLKNAEAVAANEARAREEAMQLERERIVDIRRLVRRAKLGDELADKLIADGATVDAVRAAILDHIAAEDEVHPTTQHVRFGAGDDARDKFVRGASAWLFERAGLVPLIEEAAKKDPRHFKDIALDGGGEFRGLSLVELARESLDRRGMKTRGMGRMDMIGLAFTYRSTQGGYQSTSDFAVLFENIMYKSILAAYATVQDTWSRWCRADTVADFRPSNRYRSGSLTVLDALGEDGEFKNKVVPDGQKLSISAATKGNIIGLSRQTIINDDMGSLTDLSVKLGRAAKLTIEADVFALLLLNSGLGPTQADSQPFFHANRANVNATGSALAAAALDADRIVMGAQKDISNNETLDLRPAVLLVPAGLAMTAKVLNGAPYDPVANLFQKPNTAQGMFRDVIDTPRLTGTRRYVLADPAIAPIIVVAFLEGQGQAPFLDSENGWRVDGVEWKVRLDFKAQMFDPKGAVTNAGV